MVSSDGRYNRVCLARGAVLMVLAHRLIAFLSGDQIRFSFKSLNRKTNNQTAGDVKALCCCLLRLVKQRLIGLGPKNGFKNKSLRGHQVYVYGASGVCLWGSLFGKVHVCGGRSV